MDSLLALSNDFLANSDVDFLISDSTCLDLADPSRHAVVEFGFPSYNAHALHDNPYLGFQGVLGFVDRVANAIRLREAFDGRGLRAGPAG